MTTTALEMIRANQPMYTTPGNMVTLNRSIALMDACEQLGVPYQVIGEYPLRIGVKPESPEDLLYLEEHLGWSPDNIDHYGNLPIGETRAAELKEDAGVQAGFIDDYSRDIVGAEERAHERKELGYEEQEKALVTMMDALNESKEGKRLSPEQKMMFYAWMGGATKASRGAWTGDEYGKADGVGMDSMNMWGAFSRFNAGSGAYRLARTVATVGLGAGILFMPYLGLLNSGAQAKTINLDNVQSSKVVRHDQMDYGFYTGKMTPPIVVGGADDRNMIVYSNTSKNPHMIQNVNLTNGNVSEICSLELNKMNIRGCFLDENVIAYPVNSRNFTEELRYEYINYLSLKNGKSNGPFGGHSHPYTDEEYDKNASRRSDRFFDAPFTFFVEHLVQYPTRYNSTWCKEHGLPYNRAWATAYGVPFYLPDAIGVEYALAENCLQYMKAEANETTGRTTINFYHYNFEPHVPIEGYEMLFDFIHPQHPADFELSIDTFEKDGKMIFPEFRSGSENGRYASIFVRTGSRPNNYGDTFIIDTEDKEVLRLEDLTMQWIDDENNTFIAGDSYNIGNGIDGPIYWGIVPEDGAIQVMKMGDNCFDPNIRFRANVLQLRDGIAYVIDQPQINSDAEYAEVIFNSRMMYNYIGKNNIIHNRKRAVSSDGADFSLEGLLGLAGIGVAAKGLGRRREE